MGLSPAAILHNLAGNAIESILDGGVYLLATASKLRNAAGTIISPATEGKQDDSITKLTSLDGKDFATQTTLATRASETTLAAADTKLGTIDGVLDSIKDTDGIKKITDSLPAGDNNIGNVDAIQSGTWTVQQGTPPWTVEGKDADGAAPTENPVLVAGQDGTNVQSIKTNSVGRPETVLYDGFGNPVSVILNNSIYRVEGRSSITSPDGVTDADVGALATANNRLSAASRLTDGVGWLATVVNNTIRRLETRGSVTSPDGADDVAVQSIDGVNHLAAGKANIIDSANSSVAQLAPAAEFAPSGTDVSQFASVAITVHSDEDSAVDGMAFEFSQNGSDWDDVYVFNLEASSSQTRRFQFPVCAKYFRVHYTNGSTLTTEFRVQTLLQRNNILTSIHRIEDVVKEDRSAQIVKAAIIAQREGAVIQTFHPVLADVSGNLKVTTVGSDIPADPSAFVLEFLLNGSSDDMLVDGSVTPVSFEKGPTVTNEVWSIRELLMTFTADDFEFDGASFGSLSALTNGILVNIVKASVSTNVFTVVQNEDFLRVPGRTPLVNNTGPKDVLGAALSFQGLVLNQADGDVVRMIIQDNLTSVKLKYLTATLFAVKVT